MLEAGFVGFLRAGLLGGGLELGAVGGGFNRWMGMCVIFLTLSAVLPVIAPRAD